MVHHSLTIDLYLPVLEFDSFVVLKFSSPVMVGGIPS